MRYIEFINKYKDLPNVELEAIYFILEEVNHLSRSEFLLKRNEEIEQELLTQCTYMVEEYIYHSIPVQYLVGHAYFYGYCFKVNPNVLIPRFDTEVVVDQVLKETKKMNATSIIDVGTGSGCIAIAIKKKLPQVKVVASDISLEALKVAKENKEILNVDIEIKESDLLQNINEKFDIIVSNPPYIDESEKLSSLVRNHEPHLALFSPNHGMSHYEQILIQSKNCLKEKGIIIFEIPSNHSNELVEIVKKYYSIIEIYQDLNHLNRVMVIRT